MDKRLRMLVMTLKSRTTQMQMPNDQTIPKKTKKHSVSSGLPKLAWSKNVALSATLEKALEARLAESEAEQWQSENSNAIKANNDAIDEDGCFAEEYRTF